jgi:hypothetical protein
VLGKEAIFLIENQFAVGTLVIKHLDKKNQERKRLYEKVIN